MRLEVLISLMSGIKLLRLVERSRGEKEEGQEISFKEIIRKKNGK